MLIPCACQNHPVFPLISESTHHDIDVLERPCNGPLTGTLHLGVGMRDEPTPLLGITHLLEHLIFRRMGEVTVKHNGHTTVDSMSIWATGSAAEVADFLNRAAQAIATLDELTEADVQKEKGVVASEITDHALSFHESMENYRFGTHGVGHANAGTPTLHSITLEEVLDWGHRWLTASNAVLTFTGPVPEDLDVTLPTGDVPERTEHPDLATPHDTVIASSKNGVALSLVADEKTSAFLGAALDDELTHDLRIDRGLIYSVNRWSHRVDESSRLLCFVLDARDEDVVSTTVAAVGTLRRLASEGFSDRALSTTANACRTNLAYVDGAAMYHLDEVAVDRLRRRSTTSLESELQAADTTTSAQLTESLAKVLPTLQIAAYATGDLTDAALEEAGLTVDPFVAWVDGAEEATGGRTFKSRRLGGDLPGGLTLRLTPERATISGRGTTRSLELADIAVAGLHECGCFEVRDHRGRIASIDPDDWRQSADVRAAVLELIPAERVRSLPSH